MGPDGTATEYQTCNDYVTAMPSGIPGIEPSPPTPSIPPANVQVSIDSALSSNSYAGVGFQENVVGSIGGDLNGAQDTAQTDFHAFINWGDSNQWYPADLAPNTNGGGYEFLVKGSHTYSAAGTYNVVVYAVGPDGTSTEYQTCNEYVTAMPSGSPGSSHRHPHLPFRRPTSRSPSTAR